MRHFRQAACDLPCHDVDLSARATIDPKRVYIMGASYGGYATMMGLARDPERWRCGINCFGVTDLDLFFDVSWSITCTATGSGTRPRT